MLSLKKINDKFNEAAKKLMDDVSTQFFDGSYLQMLRFIEKECEHLLI